ncbi:hypothetical protein NW767_015549 [Fusarium falciforme]|nr:hypothetical protein NW767_015549 [Fusarium falciforme]
MDPVECEEPSSAEPIASDGDVILVVGEQKTQLRVYSQCLRSASKVFNVMFGRNWSEGQGISSQSPRDVTLVEDDAHAMRLICSVIHHRNADIPDTLTAREVLQIAVEADKYDLSVALKYAREQWLKPNGDEDMTDMAYLMVAALLFCDMDAFVARSLDLIINYKETYLGLLDDENISQIIPFKTVCKKYPQTNKEKRRS